MKTFTICLLATLFIACASRRQGPQGGPQDFVPPAIVESNPKQAQLNVSSNEIEMEFDEYINLDNPSENVIISPPQKETPTIRSTGKKINILFIDSLQKNATYTIDFNNSISDFNERNVLKNYYLSFSTGEIHDSLQISGQLLSAQTLNPIKNSYVILHTDTSYSAFNKLRPVRIAKTDKTGAFTVRNLPLADYKVYSIKDVNGDLMYSDPSEEIAFYSKTVRPTYVPALPKDSAKRDSIMKILAAQQNEIILLAFKEQRYNQYIKKSERLLPHKLNVYFNSANTILPKIDLLNVDEKGKSKLVFNATQDSLTLWLQDSSIWKTDTLQAAVSYVMLDSIGNEKLNTDTIRFVQLRSKKTKEKPDLNFKYAFNLVGTNLEYYLPFELRFAEPCKSFAKESIRLYATADSVWKNIDFKFSADSTQQKFAIHTAWDESLKYRVVIDTAAFVSWQGLAVSSDTINFKVMELRSYSKLIVKLTNVKPSAFIQLIDKQEKVIAQKPYVQAGTIFEFLKPGEYYLRLFLDENANQKWDAGVYQKGQQAESVYYFPQKIALRANWDVQQDWDVSAVSVEKQKPKDLIPADK